MKPEGLCSVTLTSKGIILLKLLSDTRGSFVDFSHISFSRQECHHRWIIVAQVCTEGGYLFLILWVFSKAGAFSEDIVDRSQKFAIVEVEGVSPSVGRRNPKIKLQSAITKVLL